MVAAIRPPLVAKLLHQRLTHGSSCFQRGSVAQIEFDSAFLVKRLPAASTNPARYFKQLKINCDSLRALKTRRGPGGAEKCPAVAAAAAHFALK